MAGFFNSIKDVEDTCKKHISAIKRELTDIKKQLKLSNNDTLNSLENSLDFLRDVESKFIRNQIMWVLSSM